jgi:hypothetical protein
MVSVKMGCATRLNRSIYGINLQYIKWVFFWFHILSYILSICNRNGKIIIRTIAIKFSYGILVLNWSQSYLKSLLIMVSR